jgi:Uma2 family endonuclease
MTSATGRKTMTTHPGPLTFTADAFLAWAEEQPDGRFELIEGRVVAMGRERAAHGRAKYRAVVALDAALAKAGLDCEAFIDSVALRIDDRSVYVPDAFVRCGPPLPGDASVSDDAVVVVEVLSHSTRASDMVAKLGGYFRLPTLHHNLIVDADERMVVHHRRGAAGGIETRILREGPIDLDPPGLALVVADVLPR